MGNHSKHGTSKAHSRAEQVRNILKQQRGELTRLEHQVVDNIHAGELIAQDIERKLSAESTFGQRVSDGIASFGGSWTFILTFLGFLGLWILYNLTRGTDTFDPYPFILLNLILSCIAALQAPIIMMSQNRQEAKDRRRAENDFQVNLKAELEIQNLHLKLDQLMTEQWEQLLEIQRIQVDLIERMKERH